MAGFGRSPPSAPVRREEPPTRDAVLHHRMAIERRFAFIGAGNMASAILAGALERGALSPANVAISDPAEARRDALRAELGVTAHADNADAVKDADIVVLAVKPQVIDAVCAGLAPSLSGEATVVSIAAGVTLARLEAALGERPIVRTMPNTPLLVGQGATALAANARVDAAVLDDVDALFSAAGVTVRVAESAIDAVTGVSGSGPAFVYQFIEALSDGGVRAGLPRDIATRLAAQTVLGAATMVLETGTHPGALKDQVTSPGGTTIAGVHALERGGLRATTMNAVMAAFERARELG